MNDAKNVCVTAECHLFLWKHLCLLEVIRMLLAKGIVACLIDGNHYWTVVEEILSSLS